MRPHSPKKGAPAPTVFIVESVDFGSEKANRKEGQVLSQILNLCDKESEYRYVRTKQQFVAMLDEFSRLNMRYLHISCHGDERTLALTMDNIPLAELAPLLRPHLIRKRLFISACKVTNDKFAKLLLPSSQCYSVAGPDGNISFDDAAISWASFYHLIFNINPQSMNTKDVQWALQRVADTFSVPFRYYGSSAGKPVFKKTIIPK